MIRKKVPYLTYLGLNYRHFLILLL
uniref:Uncharacterized protein n=1 Tax=Arundo donax TaxID=35708 RepID=A0A0A8YZ18_ARUDO